MVMDADLAEEGIERDSAYSANLGTILIIEDDPRMQKVLQRIFNENIMPSSSPETGKPGLIYFVVSGPSLWF